MALHSSRLGSGRPAGARKGGAGRERWLVFPCVITGLVVAGLACACRPEGAGPEPASAARGPTATGAAAPAHTVAFTELDPPVVPGAMAPELAQLPDGALGLTWIAPAAAGARHELVRFSRLDGGAWSAPVTVAGGDEALFANWADRPGAFAAPDGALFAHWLAMNGEGTYTYEVRVARSDDGGATWRRLGRLHTDDTPAEHGFVSWVADGESARAFWLDGRATAGGGEMALRTALMAGPGAGEGAATREETLLDEAVCDCCSTTAVATAAGPLVLFRDRTSDEVRDNFAVRRTAGGWSAPYPVHRDGWTIPACPVNGPVAAAAGETVWAAWFTGAGGEAAVLAAVSRDGGRSFGEPVAIDSDGPLGRLGMIRLPGGDDAVVVSWVARDGERAAIHLRRIAADGTPGPVVALAATEASRASGVPRLGTLGGDLVVAWVDAGAGEAERSVRLARLPVSAIPR